jgi:hypothetical protein
VWRALDAGELALREGDGIQMHVTLDQPKYVYLFWCDAAGELECFWPLDPGKQEKTSRVASPPNDDEWHVLDSQKGTEMALVAVRDKPLSAEELAQFASLKPYERGEVRLDRVFHVVSGNQERGLAGLMKSRKNPLEPTFERALRETFSGFHGVVVPHK